MGVLSLAVLIAVRRRRSTSSWVSTWIVTTPVKPWSSPRIARRHGCWRMEGRCESWARVRQPRRSKSWAFPGSESDLKWSGDLKEKESWKLSSCARSVIDWKWGGKILFSLMSLFSKKAPLWNHHNETATVLRKVLLGCCCCCLVWPGTQRLILSSHCPLHNSNDHCCALVLCGLSCHQNPVGTVGTMQLGP